MKAMVHLAPKLNYTNLNIELMKYFAQLQGRDDQVLFSSLISFLIIPRVQEHHPHKHDRLPRQNRRLPRPQSTPPSKLLFSSAFLLKNRQKILLSAFARALKDPFPPARISGVLALGGTQQYYQLSEVAHRILPALSSLTMDPEKTVREHAFKAIKAFLGKMEKASENPELIAEMGAFHSSQCFLPSSIRCRGRCAFGRGCEGFCCVDAVVVGAGGARVEVL